MASAAAEAVAVAAAAAMEVLSVLLIFLPMYVLPQTPNKRLRCV